MHAVLQQFNLHPDYDDILGEVHARRELPQDIPSIIHRVGILLPRDEKEQDDFTQKIESVWQEICQCDIDAGQRSFSLVRDQLKLSYERHTEFITFTWINQNGRMTSEVEKMLHVFQKGELLSAVRLKITGTNGSFPVRSDPPHNLCAGVSEEGRIYIATSFEEAQDGFVEYDVVVKEGLPSVRLGIVVKRLLELETYRMFTLLGLPTAKRTIADLNILEQSYSDLLLRIDIEDQNLLQQSLVLELQNLLIELERLSQASHFRFSATLAYGRILDQRLRALKFQQSGTIREFAPFLEQRVAPAVSTCKTTHQRIETLSRKIALAVNLINTRSGEIRQKQNQEVLNALHYTSERQYRLQRTVEGLSVIAISYYAIGLAGYFLGSFTDILGVSKSQMMTGAVPIIILLVWLFVQRIKRQNH